MISVRGCGLGRTTSQPSGAETARALQQLELRVRREDPQLLDAEVNEHGHVLLDRDHPAEPLPIVGDPIPGSELLDRLLRLRDVEGT